jgi:hypothetical protein
VSGARPRLDRGPPGGGARAAARDRATDPGAHARLELAETPSGGRPVPTGVRVAPRCAALATAIDGLYTTRRVDLINHIASRALQRIQAIAESFRLRQEPAASAVRPRAPSRSTDQDAEEEAAGLAGVLPEPAR